MSPWFYSHVKTLVVSALTASVFFFTPTLSIAGQATLAWDHNDPVPEGYRIFQRAEGQAYDYSQPTWDGSDNTGTVDDLADDTTYYFVVRAYADTLESADSDEVSFYSPSPVLPVYTITATSGDHGGISPEGTITVDENASQTVLVSPDAGYHVADVIVDGSSIGAELSYTFNQVSADHTLTVTFAIDTHTISASAGTHGTITSAGVVSVADGAGKTYTITPDTGYQVADVLVDGVSRGAVTSYTFDNVTADHTITATFTVLTYTVTATSGGNGAITPAGSARVAHGDTQSYAISADAGCHVSDVRVDGVSVGAVSVYTFANVTANHTITAAFDADTHTLTFSAGPNGSISPAGMVPVAYGGSQGVTFTADTGFHVADVQVDGQSVGGVDQYTFTNVQGDHTLTVTFAENTPVEVWIEAEDGDLQWPMEIGDDIFAAAGGYTWVPAGSVNTAEAPEAAGYAEYQIDIPETGDYVIWGRQISTDSTSDSFFVSMDGQAEMVWHTQIGGQGTWIWDVVSDRAADDSRDATNPLRYRLEAGIHTLTVKQREAGTRLDTIVITNDLNMGVSELDSAMLTPVIEVDAFDPCISELETATIGVAVSDPEGGNLTYAWELLDGGILSGSGSRVSFTPESIGPHPCPYRVNLVVTSDADLLPAKASFEIFVRLAGDVNGDGSVNVQDKLLVRRARGLTGEPGWIPEDVNRDGLINVSDKLIVRSQTGQSGCVCP